MNSEPSSRRFGLTVAIAIVVANMIGTGVFTSAGFQAASLHDAGTMILTWVVGGVLALCGAAAYAELGTMMPKAGGEYVYLREAYHPVFGFMSGWVSLTAGFSAPIAAAALAFARYLGTFDSSLSSTIVQKSIAIALIIAVTALHLFDSVVGGRVQAVLTAAKVALILVFIIAGFALGTGDWSHFDVSHGGMSSNVPTMAFAVSLMYVSFAYSGWNAAAYIAGEIEKPERNLPRALILGTLAVMVLYVLINVVFIYALSPSALGNFDNHGPILEVGDVAGRALFGNRAGHALTTLIALALVSAVSAMVMAGPRVYAAMAEDRALPKAFAIRSRRGVPMVAVGMQAVLGIGFVMVGSPEELIRYVGFWLAIFAALTVASLFVMRRRGKQSGYRTLGYPVTPILFIALSMWIAWAQLKNAWNDHPYELLLSAMTLVGGAAIYLLMRHDRDDKKAKVPSAKVHQP
jgi:basic amino acid/polyamine antiporter, APA family